MKKIFLFFCLLLVFYFSTAQSKKHNLHFSTLAKQWDEAIPLGNGTLGALIWEKNKLLRFSLDRADVWDNRPMKGLHREEFSYQWIYNQVQKKDYQPVQQNFDRPYDNEPAPTKIPVAAIEFNSTSWGNVKNVELDLASATCKVNWTNGVKLTTIVDANQAVGWFKFSNLPKALGIELMAPNYNVAVKNIADPVGGDDLGRLQYEQGTIIKADHKIVYQQKGWGGLAYEVTVVWKENKTGEVEGVWTIKRTPALKNQIENVHPALALEKGFVNAYQKHLQWWDRFWNQSNLSIPDTLLEKQWYLEQYKFGSTARKKAPPISLQAIWTADNGRIPPWKGDFHHDLNTQLSYWPAYSGNHLTEAMGYLDHFEENKENYKRYTKLFFQKEGIAIPGVTTLDGTEMGGWIQYSLSPTVAAWIAQHYYLQWRYSMDRNFLKEKAYPFIKESATFLEQITILDSSGVRKLLMSSSPEINDNSLSAWFGQTTNYDLALIKFNFKIAAALAQELNLHQEATHWLKLMNQLPGFALSANSEMLIAPNYPYKESHRHFSNTMAIHPLGLFQWDKSDQDKLVIRNSIHLLDSIGPLNWCGYSYAWLANLKARAKDGNGAAKALTIFSNAFCSINSFHLNGDQTKSGFSSFTYRPFTLEGNFAYAAGLQEMLIQSYQGFVEIMPAIPFAWQEASFTNLRTEGAFIVSAKRSKGVIKKVKIVSEKGGLLKLKNPFNNYTYETNNNVQLISTDKQFININFNPGATITLQAK